MARAAKFEGPKFSPESEALRPPTLTQMAVRLAWLAYDLCDDIAELDLNPVIVMPTVWARSRSMRWL